VPACSRLPSPFAGPLNAMCRAVCTAEERDVKKTLLAAALLCCLPAAYAADQNDASALAPVVVTATRTPITADDALSSVTVITRLPGISFAQSGGLGQLSTLFLRGTNSTHTLVLVDGIRVGSATAGFARLEQIP